jgi:cyclopropane fatty-acyl-phospholipid synthase-like methyltransferase
MREPRLHSDDRCQPRTRLDHYEPHVADVALRNADRVTSVKIIEHVRNYGRLMQNLHRRTNLGARLFVHVFAHRHFAYPFPVRDTSDWTAEHFSPAAQCLPTICRCTFRIGSAFGGIGFSMAPLPDDIGGMAVESRRA